MARLLPLLFVLTCGAASAQSVFDTPARDAHVLTISPSEGGEFVFEVERQDHDSIAALNPGGTLVIVAPEGLWVMAVTEDHGYYQSHDDATNRPLLDGPSAVWIDGRNQADVGVMRVTSEYPRGGSTSLEVSVLVCTAESYPGSACTDWTAARPRRRALGPDNVPAGFDAALLLEVVGTTLIYAPSPPDPPLEPVRD